MWILLLVALLLSACGEIADERRPNLILIVGDDISYPDFGFMGSPHVYTPNLNRLAASGTVFRNGYTTASVCAPSLRSLLTGLYPAQFDHQAGTLRRRGVRRSVATAIQDFATLPGLLADDGYVSMQGGKIWEASYQVAGFTHGLQKLGDDITYGGVGATVGRDSIQPILDFIDEHAQQPFFLWFAPRLPHQPHDPPPEYRARYENRRLSEKAIAFYANVTRFDAVVGQLVAHLDAVGLREDSLIVYIGDNGWDQRPTVDSADLFDGPRGKMTMYDLGVHTPIILSWPGRVPVGWRNELVSAVDLFPTFLDYADARPRADRPGHSLRPMLEDGAVWPRREIIGSMSFLRRDYLGNTGDPGNPFVPPKAFFLREGHWRYIWNVELDQSELYDIERDPREEHDQAVAYPQKVAAYRRRIEAWRQQMHRPLVPRSGAHAPEPR
jgi:uncharacterized sulfatase